MEKAKKKYYIAELKKLQNRNDVEANHVKADNISLKQHKHTEQGDGKHTSAAQS